MKSIVCASRNGKEIVRDPLNLAFSIEFRWQSGSVFNDKQVSGFCGALLTNLSAWLSGAWFEVGLIGGTFEKIAYLLPFAHAVDAARAAVAGDYASILPHLAWVVGYAVVILAIAVAVFRLKMRGDKA